MIQDLPARLILPNSKDGPVYDYYIFINYRHENYRSVQAEALPDLEIDRHKAQIIKRTGLSPFRLQVAVKDFSDVQ